MSIENRVIVITGATGGLGRVVSQHLAQRGARLALVSTHEGHLLQLADSLRLPEERWMIQALDVGNREAVQAAADAVLAKFSRADILLHLVGGWTGGKPVVEVEPGEVSDMLHQHLWTTLFLAQAFVPHMVASGWGRVIAISSQTASRPAAKRAPYAVGKVAQEALILTLAQELMNSGVTANLIVVNTIDVKHERDQERTPANATWTTPEEITSAILYLTSDEAGTVNGARLPLYGSPS